MTPRSPRSSPKGCRQEGYDVLVAADGEEGVRLAVTTTPPPEALVLDLMLPKLDGFAVLGTLRERGSPLPC